MIYTISNGILSATVDSKGAQLLSLRGTKEYLWQRDEAYWTDCAPILFPFVGRLTNQQYSLDGKVNTMGIHGFAAAAKFTGAIEGATLTMTMVDNEETYRQFPRHFRFSVIFSLEGTCLTTTFKVENTVDKTMIFGLGAHPGFHVPMADGLCFEDYRLRFPQGVKPKRIWYNAACFRDGRVEDFPLENGTDLPLHHHMFDDDAITLSGTGNTVTLMSEKGGPKLTVAFPHCPYVSFWHRVGTDAPYLCIEPWATLPGEAVELTVFEEQKDLIRLPAGQTYTNTFTITVE